MEKDEIERKIVSLIRAIKPELPKTLKHDSPLTLPPYKFTRVDLLYLYLQVMESFPCIQVTADDLESKQFNSVSGIAALVSKAEE